MAQQKKTKINEMVKIVHLNSELIIEGEVEREAPVERDVNKAEIIQSALNEAQLSILLNRTPAWAVKTRVGGSGKMYKYVPHGYVTDVLNKAFGFDWDLIIDPVADGKLYALEIEDVVNRASGAVQKQNRHVAVSGHLVIRVHGLNGAPDTIITKHGFGSQLWLPTMEFGDALKAALSDLLKVCAQRLGVALDLYWNERAEISAFEGIQQEAESKKAADARMQEFQKRGIPINFPALLAKANTDFQYTGDAIEEILGVSLDEVIDYEPEQIADAWNKIVAANSKKKE
jgi:hypothetical protein